MRINKHMWRNVVVDTEAMNTHNLFVLHYHNIWTQKRPPFCYKVSTEIDLYHYLQRDTCCECIFENKPSWHDLYSMYLSRWQELACSHYILCFNGACDIVIVADFNGTVSNRLNHYSSIARYFEQTQNLRKIKLCIEFEHFLCWTASSQDGWLQVQVCACAHMHTLWVLTNNIVNYWATGKHL